MFIIRVGLFHADATTGKIDGCWLGTNVICVQRNLVRATSIVLNYVWMRQTRYFPATPVMVMMRYGTGQGMLILFVHQSLKTTFTGFIEEGYVRIKVPHPILCYVRYTRIKYV